jgi:hypothetical protein
VSASVEVVANGLIRVGAGGRAASLRPEQAEALGAAAWTLAHAAELEQLGRAVRLSPLSGGRVHLSLVGGGGATLDRAAALAFARQLKAAAAQARGGAA